MKHILIDTNIYSYAMRGDAGSITIFQRYERLLFSPIVLGELYAGFRQSRREDENRLQLREFTARDRISTVSITAETADFYSYLLNQLREAGTPVPTNDIWIAASAMEHGAGIATKDTHFLKFQGIQIVRP